MIGALTQAIEYMEEENDRHHSQSTSPSAQLALRIVNCIVRKQVSLYITTTNTSQRHCYHRTGTRIVLARERTVSPGTIIYFAQPAYHGHTNCLFLARCSSNLRIASLSGYAPFQASYRSGLIPANYLPTSVLDLAKWMIWMINRKMLKCANCRSMI